MRYTSYIFTMKLNTMDYVQLHCIFIFAAKASGYQMAKILLNSFTQSNDWKWRISEYIKVVFIPDYKVTLAEILLKLLMWGTNLSSR